MDKVFIDATATAETLHHTGIQRVVRSIVVMGALRAEQWSPVVFRDGEFRTPTSGQRQRLYAIFEKGWHRFPWLSAVLDKRERPLAFDPLAEGEDSLFLIPEIPSGERLDYLDDLAATGERQMPMVGVCHDLLSWSHPEWTARSRKVGFVQYLRFLALLERVICPSVATATEWRRFQNETGINGADPEIVAWPIEKTKASIQSGVSPLPKILSVGTLEKRKNHAVLLDAAEQLWRSNCFFELVLVGRKRAKDENEVPDRIAGLRETGFPIRWFPRISDEELERLYEESAFTVFPSLGEGFGLPVMESLVRGRPCICSGEGAVGEIAEGGGCLTVDVSESEAVAEAIRLLTTDGVRLAELSREAGEREWPNWNSWMDRLVWTEGRE
ncbi:MAG: glycosyltransferase family 1 protein [Verrucomicrobiota bacterium]